MLGPILDEVLLTLMRMLLKLWLKLFTGKPQNCAIYFLFIEICGGKTKYYPIGKSCSLIFMAQMMVTLHRTALYVGLNVHSVTWCSVNEILSSLSSSYICHGVGPLVDPFQSHVSRSLFKGLPWFLLPVLYTRIISALLAVRIISTFYRALKGT